jgi:hypothetical protein
MIAYRNFWPMYLRAHRRAATRAVHYAATVCGMATAVAAILVDEPLIFVGGLACSYLMAIGSHWFLERNQPLIAVNPLWGAASDLRMCGLAMAGGLHEELANHDALPQPKAADDVGTFGSAPREGTCS